MTIPPYFPRNTIRLAHKNFRCNLFVGWIHTKIINTQSVNTELTDKVVTWKKFEELPSAKRLPDGSNAQPLGEWMGGLELSKDSLKHLSTPAYADLVVSETSEGKSYSIDVAGRPKKRRKKVVGEGPAHSSGNDPPRGEISLSEAFILKSYAEANQVNQRKRQPKANLKDTDLNNPIVHSTGTSRRSRRKTNDEVLPPKRETIEEWDVSGRDRPVVTQRQAKHGRRKKLKDDTIQDHETTIIPINPSKPQSTMTAASAQALATSNSIHVDGILTKRQRLAEAIDPSLAVLPKQTRISRTISSPVKDVDLDKEMPPLPSSQLAVIILENLARFPHCILLTRVGNFYESYFDQAAEVARLLSIKLTKRNWNRQQVLMCGFPLMHLDRHLKTLIQTHKRCVALCEEFRRESPEGGFDRRVVRVLTPGTLIDEPFLNPYENNYLLAISSPFADADNVSEDSDTGSPKIVNFEGCTAAEEKTLGLAWIDVSTGEFFTQQTMVGNIKDDIARIAPREIVLHSIIEHCPSNPIRLAVAEEKCFLSYIEAPLAESSTLATMDLPSFVPNLDELIAESSPPPPTPKSPKAVFTEDETSAISLLTTFLKANLIEHMPSLSSPARHGKNRMQIDSQTIKALEIREEIREGGVTGSLLSVIKRTVTTSGTRLLARWLCSPSTSVAEIRVRQNLVSLFHSNHHLRDDLGQLLKRIEDASRIVQRFLLRKGDVSDLLAIKSAIDIWREIKSRVDIELKMGTERHSSSKGSEWSDIQNLTNRMVDLRSLARRIEMAIDTSGIDNSLDLSEDGELDSDEFPEIQATRTNIPAATWAGHLKSAIKPDFSPELALLHSRFSDADAARQRLEQELQQRYEAPSLTLKTTGKYGVHVHIGKSKRGLCKIDGSPHFIQIASTNSTKSYFNQTWYILGTRMMETVMQIFAAEKEAFEMLRHEVNMEAASLRRNARIIDELDVTLGFAKLASEMQFVRPKLNDGTSYQVTNGRHPSVELGLLSSGRVFTPNTVSLTPNNRLHIITGPNMAGKSTLLRQTALVAILAQIGSFVPADKAELGIVDKMFSRIGAKDDLFRDRSTFMVEMLETADILKHATDKSLVIMDEVGRGTTVKDGLAIAFAVVHHLYTVNRCRALFATHFHEVADMLGYSETSGSPGFFKDIDFYCTSVDETEDGHFTYSHRLRPGVNRDSHGLKVARLGGMPLSAMAVAHDALEWIKGRQGNWIAARTELRAVGETLATRQVLTLPSKTLTDVPQSNS